MKYRPKSFIIVVLAFVSFGFTSCEGDLDLSNVEVNRSIVVNSIFSNEGDLNLNLSFSKPVVEHDKEFESILDAEVVLIDSDSGNDYRLTHTSDGNYTIEEFIPVPGNEYDLDITMQSGKKIYANTTLPVKARVESVNADFVNEREGNAFKVEFDIIDEDLAENYYIWDVITSGSYIDPFSLEDEGTYKDYLFSYNGNSDPVSHTSRGQSKIYANDANALNGVINTSLVTYQDFSSEGQIDPNNPNNPNDPNGNPIGNPSTIDSLPQDLVITLRVITVSKELYDYYRSIELYYQNGASNSSISNPSEIYSNISCGLGIFAGYSETHIVLN